MNNEYNKQCQEFEKDFALGCINLKEKYEKEYPHFMYVGTAWAKEQAFKDYMDAKERAIEEDVKTLRRKLEIFHFGIGGKPRVVLQLDTSVKQEATPPTPEPEAKNLKTVFINVLSKLSAFL